MDTAVFRSLKGERKERAGGAHVLWDAHYQERMKDPDRYVRHLLTTCRPFFRVLMDWPWESATGESVYALELGGPPGFVCTALGQAMVEAYNGATNRRTPLVAAYFVPDVRGRVRLWDVAAARHRMMWPTINFPSAAAQTDDITNPAYRAELDHVARDFFGSPRRIVYNSFGLLEHLGDEEIVGVKGWLLDQHHPSVHYLPLEGHGTPSVGNERLLSLSHWRDLLSPIYWETFNEGKDVVLVVGDEVRAIEQRRLEAIRRHGSAMTCVIEEDEGGRE